MNASPRNLAINPCRFIYLLDPISPCFPCFPYVFSHIFPCFLSHMSLLPIDPNGYLQVPGTGHCETALARHHGFPRVPVPQRRRVRDPKACARYGPISVGGSKEQKKQLIWLVVEPTPLKKYESKLDNFPNFRGEHKNCLSCHHLVDGSEIRRSPVDMVNIYVNIPIIHMVLYIPGGEI